MSDLAELVERVTECRRKIEFISLEIKSLTNQSIECWVEPTLPYSGIIKARLIQHPPVKIRQELGMIVNEQRSILDALACVLARRNGAKSIGDVYFPITKTKGIFLENGGQQKIKKLSIDDRRKIEALNPWNHTEEESQGVPPVLFMLHEADRVRKHQNLLNWACTPQVKAAGSGIIGSMQIENAKLNEIGKEQVLATFWDVTCGISVVFRMVFSEPEILRSRSVVGAISVFNTRIEEIIALFK